MATSSIVSARAPSRDRRLEVGEDRGLATVEDHGLRDENTKAVQVGWPRLGRRDAGQGGVNEHAVSDDAVRTSRHSTQRQALRNLESVR